MFKKIFLALILSLLFLFAGCTKEPAANGVSGNAAPAVSDAVSDSASKNPVNTPAVEEKKTPGPEALTSEDMSLYFKAIAAKDKAGCAKISSSVLREKCEKTVEGK